MSADIVDDLHDYAVGNYGQWSRAASKAADEIVRLRGEVDFHRLDAGALRVQLDSCIERLEVQTKNALHLHAMMVDAENRAATVAPAEAKGDGELPTTDAEVEADNAKAANAACLLAIASGYAWSGKEWRQVRTPHPADGEAVAPFSHVCRFSDDSPWELTVHGKKHCEKCVPVYLHPPAPVQAAPQEGGDSHAFKNFHRSLCARFGYTHDENDWRRDLASLEEHIARMAAHHSACELGELEALREFYAAWKADNATGPSQRRLAAARDRVAALQHRGDSRGGES